MTTAEVEVVARFIRDQIAKVRPAIRDITLNGRDLPAPQVYNEVRTPEVHVTNEIPAPTVTINLDMQPVADAIRSGLLAVATAVSSMEEMHAQLLRILAEQPPIEFKPSLVLPEVQPNVTVQPAPVTVQPTPPRKPRTLRIKHDDGTVSTITEEG